MKITFANAEEKKDGWLLSPSFLQEVQNKIEDSEEIPSLEQIENTILAYEEIQDNR